MLRLQLKKFPTVGLLESQVDYLLSRRADYSSSPRKEEEDGEEKKV